MRGPSNLSENYFSNKTWNDYKNGFGDLGKAIIELLTKALRKTENSKFRTLVKIGRIWLPKFGIFLEIISSFVIAKVLLNLTKILKKLSLQK